MYITVNVLYIVHSRYNRKSEIKMFLDFRAFCNFAIGCILCWFIKGGEGPCAFCWIHFVYNCKNLYLKTFLSCHKGWKRGWLNGVVLITFIPFSLLIYLLFCCWCWQGADSLCSFVFICAARIQWDAVDDSIWITPAAGLEKCWKLSDTFRYLFLLKSCAVNNIPALLGAWIFSTIKVNIFFQFSLLFHFRFLSRPQRSKPGFSGETWTFWPPRGYWEKLLETPGGICIMA